MPQPVHRQPRPDGGEPEGGVGEWQVAVGGGAQDPPVDVAAPQPPALRPGEYRELIGAFEMLA